MFALQLQGVVLWAMPVRGHIEEKGVSLKLRLPAVFSLLLAEATKNGSGHGLKAASLKRTEG